MEQGIPATESAPLFAHLFNAAAETVGGLVDKAKDGIANAGAAIGNAAESISAKVDGVAGMSAEAPDGPKNEPRSQGQEQAIEKSMLPENVKSAALEAVAGMKEQVGAQEGKDSSLEQAISTAKTTAISAELAQTQQQGIAMG